MNMILAYAIKIQRCAGMVTTCDKVQQKKIWVDNVGQCIEIGLCTTWQESEAIPQPVPRFSIDSSRNSAVDVHEAEGPSRLAV